MVAALMADTGTPPISAQIKARLREARKSRDEDAKRIIGMLKAKVLNELKSGKGAEENDALWLSVLRSYAKQLRKSIQEYEKAGERGAALRDEAVYELDFCQQFLPTLHDEAATEAIIRAIVTESGLAGPKMVGRLMGLVMKQHRDVVDPAIVRSVATRVLNE
jgi:uncharacterized protein YqeY